MSKDDNPPPPPNTSKYHPALSVNNIRNLIPLILDRETIRYSNWVELFECHAHAFNVLDHIDPKTPRPTDISESMWKRLDSVVKQLIYGTILSDLLQTILARGDSAMVVWNKIRSLFQDNKSTRAIYFKNQFNALHLLNFFDISSYCQQLKSLKDQLANVDHPVLEDELVLRLVAGLRNTDFDTVAAMIQQIDPLPSFETARSCLLLEETRLSNENIPPSQSLLVQFDSPILPTQQQHAPQQTRSNGAGGRGGGRNNNRGGKGGKGRGRRRGQQTNNRGKNNNNNAATSNNNNSSPIIPQWADSLPQQIQWPAQQQWAAQWPQQWATPPYPYPQVQTRGQPGLLGPTPYRPLPTGSSQQAHVAAQQPYGPPMSLTDLGQAFSSMQVAQNDDGWYMDSGATSHMTNNSGFHNGETNIEMQ